MNGNEYMEQNIAALPGRWSKGGPNGWRRGVVTLPYSEWLDCLETIEVPRRVGIAGRDPHVNQWPGFRALEGFQGDYLLDYVCAPGKNKGLANAHFGSWGRNFAVHCGGRCSGISFSGAQMSVLENIYVSEPDTWAVHFRKATSRTRVTNIEVEGDFDKGPDAEGFLFDYCKGMSVSNAAFHLLRKGIIVNKSHSITLDTLFMENVSDPLRITGGSSGIEITGLELQRVSDTPIDLRWAGPNNRIKGRVYKSAKEVFYIAPDGERKLLGTKGNTQNGFSFEIVS